jgi:hypothetical protein
VSHLAGTLTGLLLCASYLTGRNVRSASLLDRFFAGRLAWWIPGNLLIGGGLLGVPSFVELHWSRFIAMSLCWVIAAIVAVTGVIDYVPGLLDTQLAHNTRKAE